MPFTFQNVKFKKSAVSLFKIALDLFGYLKTKKTKNKKHSENADTSTSVTFDLVV